MIRPTRVRVFTSFSLLSKRVAYFINKMKEDIPRINTNACDLAVYRPADQSHVTCFISTLTRDGDISVSRLKYIRSIWSFDPMVRVRFLTVC